MKFGETRSAPRSRRMSCCSAMPEMPPIAVPNRMPTRSGSYTLSSPASATASVAAASASRTFRSSLRTSLIDATVVGSKSLTSAAIRTGKALASNERMKSIPLRPATAASHVARASRPFDATRAGFVMGEGACVLVLEELEAARARGATLYAEVLGYGASNDAHHMAQPEPEATGVAEMMRAALRRAGVDPSSVGYINAHGTSTPLGDLAETRAIKDVFGAHAYELAVSSTKSIMGHTFGAAGAIEAMMCVLAVHEGVLPPTINYRTPDPDCDLDYVPNDAREARVDVALSNAMGLGGHNGCVLLGRVE